MTVLLNRKQLPGLVQIDLPGIDTIVNELVTPDIENFVSINLAKSNSFDNYPSAHQHCYDTFFKGQHEASLSSELYVQYSFTEQSEIKTVDAAVLHSSGATVKSRLRRLQKHSVNYIAEADDTRYTELTAECPVSVAALVKTIRSCGDVVARVRLAGVAPGHELLLHRDHDPTKLVRLHVPIETNDQCLIDCENKAQEIVSVHLERGKVYVLNTGRRHAARNQSHSWRVHLLIDVHGQNFLKQYTTKTIID